MEGKLAATHNAKLSLLIFLVERHDLVTIQLVPPIFLEYVRKHRSTSECIHHVIGWLAEYASRDSDGEFAKSDEACVSTTVGSSKEDQPVTDTISI